MTEEKPDRFEYSQQAERIAKTREILAEVNEQIKAYEDQIRKLQELKDKGGELDLLWINNTISDYQRMLAEILKGKKKLITELILLEGLEKKSRAYLSEFKPPERKQ
jgi:cell shape-determining protein MreC